MLKELADLHAKNGLTLVYVANGEVSEVSFLSRNFRPIQGSTPGIKLRSGSLSPDRKTIAFPYDKSSGNSSGVREEGSVTDSEEALAITPLNGTGLRTYENIRNPQKLCWSPNQESLALTGTLITDGQRKVSVLLVVALSSGAVQQVAQAGLSNNPCWSSDGSKLVYEKDGSVFVWSANDQNSRRLASGQWPTWRPSDNSITLYENGAYYSVDIQTGKRKGLFSEKSSYSPLWWSPDGRFAAYVSGVKFFESIKSMASEYPDEVRLRIRRIEDDQEDWAARFSRNGPWQDFQWVRTFSPTGKVSGL